MTKTATQQELDNNIPENVIHTREQGGKELSYLETWYVIDRLNQVLGQGNWGYQIVTTTKVFEGKVTQYSGEVFGTSYTAQISLFANIDGKTCVFSEVGYGDGTDKKNPGKAHELGIKEAVSDAVKRAAKNLGRSTGLALYDKTQEYVGETVSKNSESSTQSNGKGSTTGVLRTESMATNTKTRPIKELVTAAFKVLEAQKKVTKEDFKEKYLAGTGISKLDDTQLAAVFDKVKTDFPHLNL